MTCTQKNLKIVCVKFFGKIGRTLVGDLAYFIAHHLKSICRTLRTIYQKIRKISVFRVFNKVMNFITESVKKQQCMSCCS